MKDIFTILVGQVSFPNLPSHCQASALPKLCQNAWLKYAASNKLNNKFASEVLHGFNASNITDQVLSQYDGGYYSILNSPEFEIRDVIISYVYPIFLLFGSVGNIASIILIKQFINSVWSTCLYLVLLLILDLLMLYTECGNDWYFQVTGQYLSSYILLASDVICKVYMFLYNFFLHLSSWIVVTISMELMIAVRYPHSLYRMCTRERAQAILLLLIVLLLSINLHFFWTFGIALPSEETLITRPNCLYINGLSNNFRDVVWPLMDFFIRDFIPIIVVSISTVITIVTLIKRRKEKENMETMLEQYFLDLMTLYELTIAVSLVCFFYVVIELCRVTQTIIMYLANYDVLLAISYPKLELLTTTINAIMYAYISLKFVIFVYACTKFREMLKCWFQKLFRPCVRLCRPCCRQYKLSVTKTDDSISDHKGPIILRKYPKCRLSTGI